MSDHNFEKQIQQKLDELKIPPADTVWTSVEAQIRKDKRRRRGVIFFPILFILIGAGVYFMFHEQISFAGRSGSNSVGRNPNSGNNESRAGTSKEKIVQLQKGKREKVNDNVDK